VSGYSYDTWPDGADATKLSRVVIIYWTKPNKIKSSGGEPRPKRTKRGKRPLPERLADDMCGVITRDGIVYPTGEMFKEGRGELPMFLKCLNDDIWHGSASLGLLLSTCIFCGHPLSDKYSRARGFGRKCEKTWNLEEFAKSTMNNHKFTYEELVKVADEMALEKVVNDGEYFSEEMCPCSCGDCDDCYNHMNVSKKRKFVEEFINGGPVSDGEDE